MSILSWSAKGLVNVRCQIICQTLILLMFLLPNTTLFLFLHVLFFKTSTIPTGNNLTIHSVTVSSSNYKMPVFCEVISTTGLIAVALNLKKQSNNKLKDIHIPNSQW